VARVNDFWPSLLPVHFHGVPTPNPGRLNLRPTPDRVEAAAQAELPVPYWPVGMKACTALNDMLEKRAEHRRRRAAHKARRGWS
jgi:hypothetical protein